jgi:hypothetical protein
MSHLQTVNPILGNLRIASVLFLSALLLGCGPDNQVASPETQTANGAGSANGDKKSKRHSTVSFHRSKYASLSAGPASADFDLTETAQEREQALRIIERLDASWGNGEAVKDLMAEARLLETNAILRVAEKLMSHPDEDIRAEALMLADGATSTASLKLFSDAMTDSSADIRRLAMETALQLVDPATRGLIDLGLQDGDQGVRQLAFHLAMNQHDELRQDVVSQSLGSFQEDLALAALVEAEAMPSKRILPQVVQSLAHASPEVRESAQEMLSLLFHEDFTSAEQAAAWWKANASQYDEDLVFNPN